MISGNQNWYWGIRVHIEWVVWFTGLLLMATMNPYTASTTFCFFEWLGITWCPGHGLGHSIAFLARGMWFESIEAHPLGLFAVIVLINHIVRECYNAFNRTLNLT